MLPALTTFAGAAAAVGLDHVLSDSAEASRKGWYLLIGGVGFIIATGTGTLIWLRRGHRLTSGLVHAALYRGEHVATALTVLKHHAVRGQRSSAFWTPPKRWPLIVLAITGFVIALGLPLADSRWPPVVIGIASGVAPVVMYLVWNGQFRSTRPMLLDHAKRIEEVEKDRQGEMATTPVPVSPTVVIEKVHVPLALGLAMIGTLVGWAGARTAGDHRHWTTRSVNPAPPP